MGVDPYLMWIIGVEVEKDDSRFDRGIWNRLTHSGRIWLEDIEIPPLMGTGTFNCYDMVTQAHEDELAEVKRPTLDVTYYYGSLLSSAPDKPAGVVGYVLFECDDDYLLRGLWLVPGFRELFGGYGGQVVLPQMDPEVNTVRARRLRQMKREDQLESAVREHRWLEMFEPWQTDLWYSVAVHVLHLVGWAGIEREQLRPMIVFDWS